MPRKLFTRMDLDDRDPDGFKFPSKKNNNPRKASEPTTTKPPRFGENEKKNNKMRGGIQFRNKEEEKEEDGERAQFDAWIVATFFINEKRDDDNENKAVLADLREHVFKEFRHQDKRERFEGRKKEFQNLAVGMGFTGFSDRSFALDSRRSERESSTASYDGASPSPLVDIPVHVRDIVLKKSRREGGGGDCVHVDDVRDHKKRATGNFKIRPCDVSGGEEVKHILQPYSNVTGVSVDKLMLHRGCRALDPHFNIQVKRKMIEEVLAFTHLNEKVTRLGFTNSELDYTDFMRIMYQSSINVHSFDFSGNNIKRMDTGIGFGLGWMGRGFGDEVGMDLFKWRELAGNSFAECVYTILAAPKLTMPAGKVFLELNVSNCGLEHHLEVFFYLCEFPNLKRLDASRNQRLNIYEPDDEKSIGLYGCRRDFYHKYGGSIGHTGISCSLEHLNVSGSATLHFRLQPGMPFNPFANFNKLKELNLSASVRLQSVHLRDLPNLEVLNLVNCKELHTLVLVKLPLLQTLSLDICKKLRNVFYSSSRLPDPHNVADDFFYDGFNFIEDKIESLRKLSMNQCDALIERRHLNLLRSAVNLEHYRCEGLHSENLREVRIPSTSLVSVEMSGCKQIQCILLNTAKLKLLRARNCRSLKDIRVNTGQQRAASVETTVEIDVRNNAKLVSVTGLRVDRSTRILAGGATSLERIQTVD
ncbi:unnamed protein product [Bathycoccus prasinos]